MGLSREVYENYYAINQTLVWISFCSFFCFVLFYKSESDLFDQGPFKSYRFRFITTIVVVVVVIGFQNGIEKKTNKKKFAFFIVSSSFRVTKWPSENRYRFFFSLVHSFSCDISIYNPSHFGFTHCFHRTNWI